MSKYDRARMLTSARLSADHVAKEMFVAGYIPAGSHDLLPRQNFLVFQLPD